MAITQNDVSKLYVALVSRVADKKGLDYWVKEGQDKSLPELANLMIQDKDTQVVLKAGGVKDGDKGSFVKYIYTSLLNKADDAEGIKYWTDTANEKNADFGTILGWMLNALNDPKTLEKYPEAKDTVKLYENKIAVAEEAVKLYDEAEKNGVDDKKFENYNLQYKNQLDNLLKNVTSDSASLDNAKAQLKDIFGDLNLNTIPLSNKADDVVTGTPENDKFSAVVSSLSKDNTLSASDKIDGEAGDDVLAVDLKFNFSGFNKDGGVKNVETLDLKNDGVSVRSFNAKGIEGLTEVNINSAKGVNVSNVANVVELGLKNVKASSVDLDSIYAKKVLDGKEDLQVLSLDGVGAKDKSVNINSKNIEKLQINTQGADSFVKGVNVADVTIKGTANLDLSTGDKVENIDASDLSGNLTANLTSSTSLKSITTGSGDDKIEVSSGTVANFSVNGGAGTNELIINGGGTLKPSVTNVNALTLNANNALTLAMDNASSVTDLNIKKAGGDITTANSNIANVAFVGNETDNEHNVTISSADLSSVSFKKADETSKGSESVNASLQALNATALNIDVKSGVKTDSVITASKVDSINLNVEETKEAQKLVLKTNNATNLNINSNSEKGFDLSGSTLSSLTDLNVTTAGSLDLRGGYLSKISNVNLTGNGENSNVKLGSFGSITLDNSISLTASNLQAGLSVGDINSKEAISASLNTIKGDSSLGYLRSSDSITFKASDLNGDLRVSGFSAGGVSSDKQKDVDISVDGAKSSNLGYISASGNAKIVASGAGSVTISGINAKSVNVDLSKTLSDNTITSISSDDVTFKSSELKATTSAVNINGLTSAENFKADLTGSIKQDTFNITSNATKSIKVSGDLGIAPNNQSDIVSIDATDTSSATIDVSELKNSATIIKVNGNADDTAHKATQEIKGSAGADTIEVGNGAAEHVALKGDLGEGYNTITIGSSQEYNTTTASVDLSDVKNANSEIYLSKTGTISVTGTSGDDTLHIKGVASQTAFTVTGDLGGGYNTLKFDLGAATVANVTSIDFSGLKGVDVGLNANTESGEAQPFDFSSYSMLQTLKATNGDDNITIGNLGNSQTLTVELGAGNDTITTGTIATGTSLTIKGGEGYKVFDVSKAIGDDSNLKYTTIEKIKSGDKIKFTSIKDSDVAYSSNATLSELVSTTKPTSQMATKVYVLNDTSKHDTYILVGSDTTAGATAKDVLVKLAGVDLGDGSVEVNTEENYIKII